MSLNEIIMSCAVLLDSNICLTQSSSIEIYQGPPVSSTVVRLDKTVVGVLNNSDSEIDASEINFISVCINDNDCLVYNITKTSVIHNKFSLFYYDKENMLSVVTLELNQEGDEVDLNNLYVAVSDSGSYINIGYLFRLYRIDNRHHPLEF